MTVEQLYYFQACGLLESKYVFADENVSAAQDIKTVKYQKLFEISSQILNLVCLFTDQIPAV